MCSLSGNSCACELSVWEMVTGKRVGTTQVDGKCQGGQSHMCVCAQRMSEKKKGDEAKVGDHTCVCAAEECKKKKNV